MAMNPPIGRDEKLEAKQIGQDYREIEQTTVVVMAQILAKILKQIRSSLGLPKDKDVKVEVDLDGKKALEVAGSKELKVKPSRDIAVDDLKYIQRAIALPAIANAQEAAAPNEFDRNLTIKVNGEEVFRLKDGVVELNALQREQQREAQPQPASQQFAKASTKEAHVNPAGEQQLERAKRIAQEFAQQRQQGKEPSLEEVARAVDSRQSNQKEPASQSVEVENEQQSPLPQSTLESSKEVAQVSAQSRMSPKVQSQPIEAQAAEALSSKYVHSPQPEAVTPEVVPQRDVSRENFAPVSQKEAESPILVVFEREVSSRLEDKSVTSGLSGMFAKLNQARLSIQKSISSFVDQTKQRLGLGGTSKDTEARSLRQDLESLAVARTARRLIEQFGSPNEKGGRSFGGRTYQIESNGQDLSINSTYRGNVLVVTNGQISSNLSERDVKQFREIDKQLMHDARQQLDRGEPDRDRDRGKSYEIE